MVLSSAARYEKSSMSEDQIAELVSNILAAVGLKVLFWIAIHVNDAFETVRFFIYMAKPIFLAFLLKQCFIHNFQNFIAKPVQPKVYFSSSTIKCIQN